MKLSNSLHKKGVTQMLVVNNRNAQQRPVKDNNSIQSLEYILKFSFLLTPQLYRIYF